MKRAITISHYISVTDWFSIRGIFYFFFSGNTNERV
jgi:hypothetical protein